MKKKIYIQITSGRGPAECCRVVALVVEEILRQAKIRNIRAEVIEREVGTINRTLFSAILSLEGEGVEEIVKEWEGTVLWIAKSPYRIYHKRKNWFVGVTRIHVPKNQHIREKDFTYQSLKASGPGGQHVNKTESAIRATHIPSGLSVTASDHRSQLQNKKLATERLLVKLAAWDMEQAMQAAQQNWNNHNQLERGNPVKTIQKPIH